MEDLAPILWIVVIFGAMVLSSASKIRKQAEKAAKHLEGGLPGQEAWPSWDTSSAPEPEETAAADLRPDAKAGAAPSVFETIACQTTAFRHPAEQREPAAQNTAVRTPILETESPQNGEQSDIAEDFDLRRAIIYSEILKPKFDE